MPEFEIKDSGKRYQNENGGVRDTAEGKINYLLIPHEATRRVAQHYTNGLKKYGKDNWKLLDDPESIERFKISADRHLRAYLNHETPEEDHAAAAIFNIMALIYFEEQVQPPIYIGEQPCPAQVNYVVTKTQFEKDIEGE